MPAKQNIIGTGNRNHERIQEVAIQDWDIEIIENLVDSEQHRDELIKALNKNKLEMISNSSRCFKFYTDGSLVNRGSRSNQTKMGAAWIQVEDTTPESSFQSGVQDWPSACRAEATAIITALLTVPREAKAIIVTDSQNCIDTYNRISKADPRLTTK